MISCEVATLGRPGRSRPTGVFNVEHAPRKSTAERNEISCAAVRTAVETEYIAGERAIDSRDIRGGARG
jgi:hypothetical protein